MAVSLCCRRLKFNIKKSRFIQPHRNGYIVLLPEINQQLPEQTALLKNDIPDFSNLDTDKCVNVVGKHLLEVEHGVTVLEEQIEKNGCKDVISEIVEPIEKLNAPLSTSWGIVKTLYATSQQLMPASSYLGLHDRARRARSAKYYSKPIYNACKECDESKMTEEEQRVVTKCVLEGHLSGLDLPDKGREILATIHKNLAEEKDKFKKRVEVSTQQFSHIITDYALIRDFPESLLKLMSQNRRDEAKLLGYPTYADMSMETKMAGTLQNAEEVLAGLLEKAKPKQDREIGVLQQYAWDRGFEGVLQLWDIPYWQRKQKKTLFNFEEEMLRDYFPLDKVLSGLMALCERVFGLKFVEATNVDRWHPDVRFFHIFEEDSKKPLAGFYLDPFIREGKINAGQNSMWMIGISPAAKVHKNIPLAAVIMNLSPPLYGKPSLLAFSEVQGLFQKFGHMLQHVLSNVHYAEVSGLNNVEWDAVGICSNFIAYWLYDQKVIESISGHYAKDEKIPDIPWAQLQQHMAGFNLCEELFKAHLDLEMYSSKTFWLDIVRHLWPLHYILPLDKWYAHPCSFTAIVNEEWAAAYFSHVWSRMVAADIYSAFTENEAEVENIGSRFRDTFFAFGGSCHPSEVFRRFRGRDPSPKAFLSLLGLH